MTLNPVNQGDNKFCGPAVISSIAGITTDEAEKMIQSIRGTEKPVTYTTNHELEAVFKSLGWRVNQIPSNNRSIFMIMMLVSQPGIYLFYVPGHVVAIEIDKENKRYLIDNHTKQPLKLGNSARLGQKVKLIYRLEK